MYTIALNKSDKTKNIYTNEMRNEWVKISKNDIEDLRNRTDKRFVDLLKRFGDDAFNIGWCFIDINEDTKYDIFLDVDGKEFIMESDDDSKCGNVSFLV